MDQVSHHANRMVRKRQDLPDMIIDEQVSNIVDHAVSKAACKRRAEFQLTGQFIKK